MSEQVIAIRMGTADLHFRENGDKAIQNLLNGRPINEGRIPPTYIPDQRFPSGWMHPRVIAD